MPLSKKPSLACPPVDVRAADAAGCAAASHGPASRWFASHELRTPLQAIKGGVELLLEERGTGLSALQVEAIGLIAGATAELERCVLMLTELAALDAQAQVPLRPQRLGDWLARPEVARHLSPTARLAAAFELEVLLALPEATRALACVAESVPASGSPGPVTCDLTQVGQATCSLDLALGHSASGDGAVAWRLAAALFSRAGVSLRPSGTTAMILTLRRP